MSWRGSLVLLLAACSSQPPVPPREGLEEPSGRRAWRELRPELPVYPREENLIRFEVTGATSNRFSIDAASIAPGTDGVIRYVVVIKPPTGEANASFEGMRCTTREVKRYAFGRADATWSKARNEEWRPIRYDSVNPYQTVLYEDFFCPGLIPVRSQREAVDALKNGAHHRAIR